MTNLIVQKNNKQPSLTNGMMYGYLVSESCYEPSSMLSPKVIKLDEVDNKDKSDGKEQALAVGCNADNGNAASRTAICNNATSNGNSNFAVPSLSKKLKLVGNMKPVNCCIKKLEIN